MTYVTALMPCLNEAKTLPLCIEKAQVAFSRLNLDGEVVVADNGSTDGSVAIAKDAGARVVSVPSKGYGAALIGGISAAHGKIIIMADADDSYDWSDLGGFVHAIEAGNDLVMGNRFLGGIEPGAMPPLHRYLGNPVLSFISRLAFRIPIGDFHCGMRAFTPEAFKRMGLRSSGMEFATEMVASAAHHGLRIAEIPIKLYPDKRGRPPHLRSFRDGWRHLRFILSHAPDHVFLIPGFLMLMLGIMFMATLFSGPVTIAGYYYGVHFMILGAMLALTGTNILSMGLLAKIILGLGPPDRSRYLRYLLNHEHLLEWTLFVGVIVFVIGIIVDLWILLHWFGSHAAMEFTIHPAIAASSAVVIGLEVIFLAFMLFLARTRIEKSGFNQVS